MNKYLAFISYRHRKLDQRVSYLLRRYLESIYLPADCKISKRRKCFRDTDELPTSTDLGADIEHALENSDYLIAVCSEDYVQSQWCMREIDLYIEQGKKSRILPILVSGDESTSVPEQIRDLPVALDLRNMNSRQIRAQMPDLLSVMSGTKREEIAASDRRHRTLVMAEIFGAVSLVILGVIAYALSTARSIRKNNEEIVEATAKAAESEKKADEEIAEYFLRRAGYLSHKAWTAIGQGNDKEALNYAMSALSESYAWEDTPGYVGWLPDSTEAVDALRAALAMPQRQNVVYSAWNDGSLEDPWENGYYLTGKYTQKPGINGSMTFEDSTYVMETDADDGTLLYISFDEDEIFALTEEKTIDSSFLKEGYTHLFPYGERGNILYGGTVQTALFSGDGEKKTAYTLEREPFSADDIWTSQGETGFFVATDGDKTALFYTDKPEAISTLSINGKPVCVAYNHSVEQMAVVDSNGTLSLFLLEDGTKTAELDGKYRFVTYAGENYKLYVITDENEFRRIHALSQKTEMDYDIPFPITTASYCARKDLWLAAGEHGYCIFDGSTGNLLAYDSLWMDILACAWEGFDEALYTHDGNGYILIGKEGAVFMRADSENSFDTAFLLETGGVSRICRQVYYSSDGRYVYLESENGDLTKWDLWSSDPLLWENKAGWKEWPDVGGEISFSRSGIWRPVKDGHGIELIDDEYGETIFRPWWLEKASAKKIRESNMGFYILTPGEKGALPMILFDAEDGSFLWSAPAVGDALPGSDIYCLDTRISEGKTELVYKELDYEDGSLLKEQVLCVLDDGEAGEITLDEENFTAVVDDIWLVDLSPDVPTVERIQPAPEVPLIFAEEPVSVVKNEGRTMLVNAEDGHFIIDAGDQKICVSPAGDSMVLYGGSKSPYVIFASDMDTLYDKAWYRVNDEEEIIAEMQEWLNELAEQDDEF